MKESIDLTIPYQELAHDVPVDPHHVELLKASIVRSGQLSPVLVWIEDNQIIDGFHRHQALSELGRMVRCQITDCSPEEFRDARITSAVTHRGVIFPRVVMWAREVFGLSEWAERMTPAHAFHIDREIQTGRGIKRIEKDHRLSADEMGSLWSWVCEKADIWGMNPEKIARMLDIADLTTPYLVSLVREKRYVTEPVLTRPTLSLVTTLIPEHTEQEAVVQKALNEQLREDEMRQLAAKYSRSKDVEEKEIILTTPWEKQKPTPPPKKLYVPPSEEEIRSQQERWIISYLTGVMGDVAEKFEPEEILGFINRYPDLKLRFDQVIEDLSLRFVQYQSGEVDMVRRIKERLAEYKARNVRLEDENRQMGIRLERFERIYGLAQRIEEESQKAQE